MMKCSYWVQYWLGILQQLRSERDGVAFQLSNPTSSINSEIIEELQREISRSQQQLQLAEEQIRVYEPDPTRFTSIWELESCEKHLLDTLTIVMQRKEYLLSNHLSPFAPSSIEHGMPTSLDSTDVVNWFPDAAAGHNHDDILSRGSQNHTQIFDAVASMSALRELSSTMYDPIFVQGTRANAEAHNIGGCPGDVNFPQWPPHNDSMLLHPNPNPISPSLYSSIQDGIEEAKYSRYDVM